MSNIDIDQLLLLKGRCWRWWECSRQWARYSTTISQVKDTQPKWTTSNDSKLTKTSFNLFSTLIQHRTMSNRNANDVHLHFCHVAFISCQANAPIFCPRRTIEVMNHLIDKITSLSIWYLQARFCMLLFTGTFKASPSWLFVQGLVFISYCTNHLSLIAVMWMVTLLFRFRSMFVKQHMTLLLRPFLLSCNWLVRIDYLSQNASDSKSFWSYEWRPLILMSMWIDFFLDRMTVMMMMI